MNKIVTGKWVGVARDRWPLGRGVAIYMRPKKATRYLDAGVRLGDRMIAVGTVIRRVLHDLFAPLDVGQPANGCCTKPTHLELQEPKERQKAA